MTWMISNVVCHRDTKDNIYPRKERAGAKIDGPFAAIMGLGRAMAVAESSAHSQAFVDLNAVPDALPEGASA